MLDSDINPLNHLPMKASPLRRLGIVLAMTVPVVLFAADGPSHADASYTSHAEGQIFHVTISNDKGSIPTLPDIDAGVGTAQASFTSFGGGVARAASPDAGSAASLPALLGAVVPGLIPTKQPIPFPSIATPGDITAQAGQGPQKVGTGPYELDAAVTSTSANARTSIGGSLDSDNGAATAMSTANITVGGDGSVTSSATSTVDGVKINGLLKIGEVTSQAQVVRDPTGGIHRSSNVDVNLIEVAGVSIGYHNGRFQTLLGNLPLPIDFTQVTNLVSKATKGMFTLRVAAAQNTPNGVVSGSLQLVEVVPPPPKCVAIPLPTPIVSGVTYCGTTTVVYDFGKAMVSTDYTVIPPPTVPPIGGGSTSPPTGGGSSYSPPPAAVGLPVMGAATPVGMAPTGTPVATTPAQVPLTEVSARFDDMSNIYLAIVGFAGLILLSSTCIRMLGVRNAWTS